MSSVARNSDSAAAVRRAVSVQHPQLLAMLRPHCGARLDAEEILQAGLERALERAEQLRHPAQAEAWVARVVRNVLMDELRKRASPLQPIDDVDVPTVESNSLDCSCVIAQVERLKPEHASILRRVVVDGVPATLVAQELGLTPNNAMVRLHRARAALKKQMSEHCGTTSSRACSDCGCAERGCC
jgi:RNA polymerase sigma-70 factor (ECF subfamily)